MPNSQKSYFNIAAVKKLGQVLVEIARQDPLRCMTERDFGPIVLAYLHAWGSPRREIKVKGGRVDFLIGTTNRTFIELAVAPRALRDPNYTGMHFPGAGNAKPTQHYPSQNRTELKKLAAMAQSRAKLRVLLLLDLLGTRSAESKMIFAKYEKEADDLGIKHTVQVIYASRREVRTHQLASRQKPGRYPRAPRVLPASRPTGSPTA